MSTEHGTDGARPMSRRAWIGAAAGAAAVGVVGERLWRSTRSAPAAPAAAGTQGTPATTAAPVATPVLVYASPGCGCCHAWVDYLKADGFTVTVEGMNDVTPMKRALGVPEPLWSCHTAKVGDYVVEGHVPSDLIRKVLAERPAFAGLAAAGMPGGSPGMEGAPKETYEITAFTRDGRSQVYAIR